MGGIHVFQVVVLVDHVVHFEHDVIMCLAHLGELLEFLQVLSFATTDLDIGGFVEGVARDSHDVDVLAESRQPVVRDPAAVRDNRYPLNVQCLLAVSGKLS